MAITIRYDTKKRLVDILANVQTIVNNTVAPAIPAGRQYFEGWVFYVRPIGNTQIKQSANLLENTTIWLIEILSPDVGMDLRPLIEDNMLKYADALQTELALRPRLEDNTRAALAWVTNAVIVSDSGLIAPSGYPVGQNQNEFYVYRFNLQVKSLGEAC